LFILVAGFSAALLVMLWYVRALLRSLQTHGAPSPLSRRNRPLTKWDDARRLTGLLARGQVLLEQKHPADALGCFEQALALEGPSADVFVKKGLALDRLGRLDEALAAYEQALALDGTNAEAMVGKGNVLNQLDRYEEALVCFEQAAAHQPRPAHLPASASNPH
jgi:tetratricopeptide (TPR) repeat protein